jgi:ER membrane protein complex subunit 1
MAKSFASYTLHVSTLSPSTGEVIISANILSKTVDPLAHFTVLTRPNTTQPQALWIEETLRFVGLTPTLKEKGRQLKGTGYTRAVDIGLNDQGHAVISRKEGSSFILKFDEVNSAKSVWEFLRYRLGKVQTLSTLEYWILGLGIHMLHGSVGRINWKYASFSIMVFCSFCLSLLVQKGSADIFRWTLGRRIGVLSGFVFPFDTTSHGIIGHEHFSCATVSLL